MKWIFSLLTFCSFLSVTAQVGVKWNMQTELPDPTHLQQSWESANYSFNLLEKYSFFIPVIPSTEMNYAQHPLGLFCKIDASMDQKLPFKMRFRLGEFYYNELNEYGIETMKDTYDTTSY